MLEVERVDRPEDRQVPLVADEMQLGVDALGQTAADRPDRARPRERAPGQPVDRMVQVQPDLGERERAERPRAHDVLDHPVRGAGRLDAAVEVDVPVAMLEVQAHGERVVTALDLAGHDRGRHGVPVGVAHRQVHAPHQLVTLPADVAQIGPVPG